MAVTLVCPECGRGFRYHAAGCAIGIGQAMARERALAQSRQIRPPRLSRKERRRLEREQRKQRKRDSARNGSLKKSAANLNALVASEAGFNSGGAQ